jgi:hypothetical protein
MRQIMMCTPCISKELWVFKIIIIYTIFVEFIDNENKLEEGDGADDNVYTLHA